MTNGIIEFLNIKEEMESISCQSLKDELLIEFSLTTRVLECPTCKERTSKVLNKYLRKINHGLFLNRKCTVLYHQKRYRCPFCQSSFNEPCSLVTKGAKKSLASYLQIMELLKDPHITFKLVGELLNLSTQTVLDTFLDHVPEFKPVLPRALCIDEVYLGRKSRKKYVAVLMDFETGLIIDIIQGRTKNDLHSYFQRFTPEERQHVEYLSCDMYEGFRFLKTTYFKKAKVCIDPFHVIQLINTVLDNEIKRVMNRYEEGSTPYYLLKKKRSLLLKNAVKIDWTKREYNHHFKYTITNHKMRELQFEIDPIIKEIYSLKEEYLWINARKDLNLVETKLDHFISTCVYHTHSDLRRVGRTLMKWKREILNSFTWLNSRRISNGPIESRNNIIKLLIRNAAGYRNLDTLRLRILYVLNAKKKGPQSY